MGKTVVSPKTGKRIADGPVAVQLLLLPADRRRHDWSLDEHTRRTGRRGVAQAQEILRRAACGAKRAEGGSDLASITPHSDRIVESAAHNDEDDAEPPNPKLVAAGTMRSTKISFSPASVTTATSSTPWRVERQVVRRGELTNKLTNHGVDGCGCRRMTVKRFPWCTTITDFDGRPNGNYGSEGWGFDSLRARYTGSARG